MNTVPPILDETVSACPDFSPGPVDNDEQLLRAVIKPDHIVQDEIQPAAVPIQDLTNRGFSVHRMGLVTPDLVTRKVNRILARPFNGQRREFQGAARFTAQAVRTIAHNATQVFVVIDTATNVNPGHASIHLAITGLSESQQRQMRNKLLPFLEDRITPIEAAFQPA